MAPPSSLRVCDPDRALFDFVAGSVWERGGREDKKNARGKGEGGPGRGQHVVCTSHGCGSVAAPARSKRFLVKPAAVKAKPHRVRLGI